VKASTDRVFASWQQNHKQTWTYS